ncbi:MAG TPA: CHRD domain-containing protein [Candidatus Binatia bacterium]
MNRIMQKFGRVIVPVAAVAVMIGTSYWATAAEKGEQVKVNLTGEEEVPPVKTSATGSGTITIAADKSVSGSVTTKGIEGTAAHIHDGAPDKNGPVIIPLTKGSDNTTWSVPAGAKLTDAQYEAFKAGNLYVNVHSAAHKGGEIRAQLKP